MKTAISYFYFFYLVQIRNQHLQKPLITKYQDSNPSDCEKYNENMKFLGRYLLILFIIEY